MQQVFDRLKTAVDPKVVSEREKAVKGRVRAQYERAQKRLAELVPFTVHSPAETRRLN